MKTEVQSPVKVREIALIGNPNSGKTTLFNALTGMRQSTANYPGVTVQKKKGQLKIGEEKFSVLDLPGTYSLLPRSLDEQVVHDVLFGMQKGTSRPDFIVMVLDANNLERNMYLLSQVLDLRIPTMIALTMWDLAESHGIEVDLEKLAKKFGCPCCKVIANRGVGIEALRATLQKQLTEENIQQPVSIELSLPEPLNKEIEKIADYLKPGLPVDDAGVYSEALRLIADVEFNSSYFQDRNQSQALRNAIIDARNRLAAQGIDWASAEAEARYACIEEVVREAVSVNSMRKASFSEKMDRLLTHRVWGLFAFFGIMGLIFQAIFTWVGLPMDLIAGAVEGIGSVMDKILPDGQLKSLVIDGMIAGVGNVLIFLPQIFMLFFLIAFLEDFGYMARAAFVLDRVMKKVGLNGKAFLPLLSSFACAIPGVMATRTIEQRSDRLATIMVAPLMSCSARLPVYILMISAFIPAQTFFGVVSFKGITLFSLYLFSLTIGLGMAALFRKTLLKGERTPFVFEMPPYRMPHMKSVLITTWQRGYEFIERAGSIIFILSIILWFLVSYPKNQEQAAQFEQARAVASQTFQGEALEQRLAEIETHASGAALRHSFAGRLGKAIEPVIEPLGFDWKLGIGIVGSFAAREVLVSTLAIVYNVGADADENSVDLIGALRSEKDESGNTLYTPLTAVSLMVFFVLACQCMSTVAIVRRETNSWRWPIFMILYMTALAWSGSFIVYQGGKLLGWGT